VTEIFVKIGAESHISLMGVNKLLYVLSTLLSKYGWNWV